MPKPKGVGVYHSKRSVNRVVQKDVKGVYTAMIKDPFKEWDRVDTFLHSLSTWVANTFVLMVCVPLYLLKYVNHMEHFKTNKFCKQDI